MADAPTRFQALPARQKATVVIFLLIFVFVIWEVIGMFRGGGSGKGGGNGGTITTTAVKSAAPPMTASPPKKLAQATPMASTPMAAKPASIPPPPLSTKPPAATMVSGPGHASPSQSRPLVEPSLPPSGFMMQQDMVQNKYVSALNDLQMLKIQKEIAETSQAIVAAKLATVTAEKSISDVLEESKMPTMTSKGPTVANSATVSPPPGPPGAPGETSGPATYSVQSVTMEQDQWHAVIKMKKQLYDVSVGDVMPPDGSLVKAIDQRGVTLESGGVEMRVPLTMTDNEPSSSKDSSGGSSDSSDTSGSK